MTYGDKNLHQLTGVRKKCDRATQLIKNLKFQWEVYIQGFLDNVKHTGDSLELFQSQKGYHGQLLYVPTQVVVDNGFITANETAAVEFAYEIFKILKVDSDDGMAQWYDNFKNGAIQ